MVAASYVQSSFIGGEVSKSVQGQFDNPKYRSWMNVCLNGMPMEQMAWTRRPGTMHLGATRGGAAGRVISFDFKQASPYTMEFTAGYLRFRAGPALVMTNDQQAIVSISTANPAKVLTGTHGWPATFQVVLKDLGTNNPLLQNRVFAATRTSTTEFTLADAITGASIDGSTLGTFVSGNVARVYEIATPYTGELWSTLRRVQADIPTSNATTPGAFLLHGSIKPYLLQVTAAPTASAFATFSLAAAVFKDGPYFDPVPGGTLATPSAKKGNITLALSFNAYDSAKSYSIGDYATTGGVNYKSLTDGNVGNAPAGSPANWVAVSAADAIGPNGFQASDIGRHVRLFSEPAIWVAGTTYAAGDVVAYGGTGVRYDGDSLGYWKSLVGSNTGNVPGVDLTKWALFPTGAIWSWGRITALTNIINRASGTNIGDMTSGGGLAAAFDGNLNQAASASAEKSTSGGVVFGGGVIMLSSYVGKNFSAVSDQQIAQSIVYPSNDNGLAVASGTNHGGPAVFTISITLNLRGKASAPASASDGTLLATSGAISNTTSPVTLVSTDQTTAWKYFWVEQVTSITVVGGCDNYSATNSIAEVSFINPAGTGTSAGVTMQIVGDDLLYTTPIRTWRMGLYSDTTGWPTCGTWHEGRLWLSGVIANRIDSSRSNDPLNFAPTNPDGTVPGNAGISYTFNAPDVNPIFWLEPDDHGIVCGTQAGEWLVQATSQNLPLTPTTIQAHRYTKYNCANILPARTNLTLAVVQAFKRELLEYFADVFNGRFSAHDLALNVKHLMASGIAEIGYQQELIPTIWARMADGTLKGMTYSRQSLVSSQPPDAAAWHRVTLGSGRTVESITIGANNDGTLDAVVAVTNDSATGIRHVEMLSNVFLETDTLADAWMLDNAVEPSSTSSSNTPSGVIDTPGYAPYGGMTINGLWHLNGATVQVFAAGLDCGDPGEDNDISDFMVTDGSVFVPYGDGVSAGSGAGLFTAAFAVAAAAAGQIVVGFTYNSDGQIVRPNAPAESGARNGPAFGKLRRNEYCALLVNQTAGLSIGTDFVNLDPVKFNDPGAAEAMGAGQTFSGVFRQEVPGNDDFDGMLCWRISRPLPATIAAIGGMIHTKDV